MREGYVRIFLISLVIAVVLALAAGAIFIVSNQEHHEDTGAKESPVGCYFEYRVVGNCGDGAFYSGSEIVTFLSEDSKRYQVRTETSIYLVSSSEKVPYEGNGTVTQWVDKDKVKVPGTYVKDVTAHTYWGTQTLKSYIVSDNGTVTTVYKAFGDAVMEKVVESGDILRTYMLKNTDYINTKPGYSLVTYDMNYDFNGTAGMSDAKTELSGQAKMKVADSTSTCYRLYEKLTGNISGTDEYDFEGTIWMKASEDLFDVGEKIDEARISTSFGDLDVDVYQKTTKESIKTYYIYRGQIVMDMRNVAVADNIPVEMTGVLKSIVVDGKRLSTLYELDEFIDNMV